MDPHEHHHQHDADEHHHFIDAPAPPPLGPAGLDNYSTDIYHPIPIQQEPIIEHEPYRPPRLSRDEIYALQWEENYLKLEDFKKKNGHCNVQQNSGSLGFWVCNLRTLRKKGKLSTERVQRLDALEFNWVAKERRSWYEWYMELVAYHAHHGHSRVPQNSGPLGRWVNQQRVHCAKLSHDKFQKLEALDFFWGNKRGPRGLTKTWEERLDELEEYRCQHGNCNVPTNGGSLGIWVNTQRQMFRKNRLSEDRITILTDMGFAWGTSRGEKTKTWGERYSDLKAFQTKHGHCNVPRQKGLGVWVNNQRFLQRKGKLTDEQVLLLDKIGFVWNHGSLTGERSSLARASIVSKHVPVAMGKDTMPMTKIKTEESLHDAKPAAEGPPADAPLEGQDASAHADEFDAATETDAAAQAIRQAEMRTDAALGLDTFAPAPVPEQGIEEDEEAKGHEMEV